MTPGAAPAARIAGTLVALAGIAGCVSPVDNPSEYDSQRPLCEEAYSEEWRWLVEACRAENEGAPHACHGMLSFSGALESRPVTVESRMDEVSLAHRDLQDGSHVLVSVDLVGRSPYFTYRFSWRGMGGDLVGGADNRTLEFEPSDQDELKNDLTDDVVVSLFVLSVGSAAHTLHPRGELFVTRQRENELSGTFTQVLGEEEIQGCFHAFSPPDDE